MKKETREIAETIAKVVLAPPALFALVTLDAFVLTRLWNWHVVPWIGHPVTTWQTMGLCAAYSAAKSWIAPRLPRDDDGKKALKHYKLMLVMLTVGWIARWMGGAR